MHGIGIGCMYENENEAYMSKEAKTGMYKKIVETYCSIC